MSKGGDGGISAAALAEAVAKIFVATGVSPADAAIVAEDLVAADVEGVGSHGVMLVPMYVDRLRAGSVSTASAGEVVSDREAAVVIDAHNVLGQLTARQAVSLAVERAKRYGLAAVTVRNAFHFGSAGRYARMMADQGCVGMVMANTRPLMPAPGGAEPLTGNNPLAIVAPSKAPFSPEIDMALSAVAMGKIRNAAAAGQPIPEGWAADKSGAVTTDPKAAIEGMLLPAAGPKGFGLAFLADLLCGGLSDGGIGAEVAPLYGPPAKPYGSASLFLAIDVGHFVDADKFATRTEAELARVAASRRAPGVERIYAPGELAFAARTGAAGRCRVSAAALSSLIETGRGLGVDVSALLSN
ncbi:MULTISPECIES: Ldh family oxidoreductase [unclassified Beijerinckia]|uniref:Ldh family oxidoreductase n=1 Tax=unclassified Beijerinckia TaxID=2638183 RepID=UPI00089CD3F5|nr:MULTISPECIES: Ldh family oxidoreductase [unclassified Beijerinckia]MDH7799525.1 LDH2 family malate/lactate/ureidoglycolate dehydrogenase [Beijerinckia sp. GAS462]SEB45893.1 Malate/lactate/ureidoglycolate dehydrogenase, LDH2 family [Beijerinckia sp. 28-YEA-48]